MKVNWGTGILIGMISFIGFILYFVVTMSVNKKYSHDLVTESYYAKEMMYQNEIDAEENTKSFSQAIVGKRTSEGWMIVFPKEINAAKIEGTVFLYRPSNKQLDFEFPLEISGSNLLIPHKRMLDGRWNITIEWTLNGKAFLYKDKISY